MTDPQKQHDSSIEWVYLKSIKTDPRVNTRPVDQAWVARKFEEGFDIDKLGTPAVSFRGNGKYIWLDGQHRGSLAELAGFGGERIEVRVFYNLSLADEATIFLGLNDNRRITAIHKFRARVTAREPAATDITKIIGRHGWKVVMGGANGEIAASTSLDSVYNKGAWVLEQVMAVISDAWGLDRDAGDGNVIRGLGQVVHRFGDDLDVQRLAVKLKSYRGGPARLVADAQGLRDVLGGTVATAVARKAVDAYNRQSRPAHRLTMV